jgi:dihydrolipoamide dehydrogenase
MKTNTVVIGGGPGGYVAAIRLAQLGIETTIIEKNKFGGTCLNVGCIPSKALIHIAKSWEKTNKEFSKIGIHVKNPTLDFAKSQEWKNGVVEKLSNGVEKLLLANGINIIKGGASFIDQNNLAIRQEEQNSTLSFENCILATGSLPNHIPGMEVDQKIIMDSTGALNIQELPSSMTIIGGGYIGVELGIAYAKLGVQVHIIEAMDSILNGFDADARKLVERKLKRLKVKVHVATKIIEHQKDDNSITFKLQTPKKEIELTTDCAFVSIGRKPFSASLNLDKCNLETDEKGFLTVNNKMQTATPHIYAIGDLVGQPMLAHKASREGEVAAENIAGKNTVFNPVQIPAVVFTDPEIAVSGITQPEAEKQGIDFKVAQFPYSALGRAMTTNEIEGFAKVITDQEDTILGITIVGAQATDLISAAANLVEQKSNTHQVSATIHPHPTFGEVLMEASKAVLGEAIHILNK